MKFFSIVSLLLLTSCTYSINMAHTQGSASDLIDETQTSNPDVKPNLTLPVI